jgi:hypothetical protein
MVFKYASDVCIFFINKAVQVQNTVASYIAGESAANVAAATNLLGDFAAMPPPPPNSAQEQQYLGRIAALEQQLAEVQQRSAAEIQNLRQASQQIAQTVRNENRETMMMMEDQIAQKTQQLEELMSNQDDAQGQIRRLQDEGFRLTRELDEMRKGLQFKQAEVLDRVAIVDTTRQELEARASTLLQQKEALELRLQQVTEQHLAELDEVRAGAQRSLEVVPKLLKKIEAADNYATLLDESRQKESEYSVILRKNTLLLQQTEQQLKDAKAELETERKKVQLVNQQVAEQLALTDQATVEQQQQIQQRLDALRDNMHWAANALAEKVRGNVEAVIRRINSYRIPGPPDSFGNPTEIIPPSLLAAHGQLNDIWQRVQNILDTANDVSPEDRLVQTMSLLAEASGIVEQLTAKAIEGAREGEDQIANLNTQIEEARQAVEENRLQLIVVETEQNRLAQQAQATTATLAKIAEFIKTLGQGFANSNPELAQLFLYAGQESGRLLDDPAVYGAFDQLVQKMQQHLIRQNEAIEAKQQLEIEKNELQRQLEESRNSVARAVQEGSNQLQLVTAAEQRAIAEAEHNQKQLEKALKAINMIRKRINPALPAVVDQDSLTLFKQLFKSYAEKMRREFGPLITYPEEEEAPSRKRKLPQISQMPQIDDADEDQPLQYEAGAPPPPDVIIL